MPDRTPVVYDPKASYEAVVSWARDYTLIVNDAVHTFDLMAEVAYDPRDPRGSLAKQPGLVCWWGSLVARISELAADQKLALRVATAREAKSVREHLYRRDGKATDDRVKEEVRASEALRVMEFKLIQTQTKLAQARAVMAALRDRHDSLMALLTGQRGEFYGASRMSGRPNEVPDNDDNSDHSEG